jgi:deoxyribonuclease (pyrimidine dimer)
MTRINCGIPPKQLTRQHLLAEAREIKRIPNVIAKGKYVMKDIPEKFTLGKGHVKFFYNKLGYLKKRYEQIYAECLERGYNVTYFGNAWDHVPKELMGDYLPSLEDIKIVQARIDERLFKG